MPVWNTEASVLRPRCRGSIPLSSAMQSYKQFPPEDMKALSKTFIGHCYGKYRVIENRVDFMRDDNTPVYYLVFEGPNCTYWGLYYYKEPDHDFGSIACVELEPVEVTKTVYQTKAL